MAADFTSSAFDSATQPCRAVCFVYFGDPLMPVRHWQAVLLTFVVLCGLGGCSGNYKYNDNTYRPLGDPQAVNRGK